MDNLASGSELFFFDVVDDGSSTADAYGMVLPSWDEAHIEAKILACEIMRDRNPLYKRRNVTIRVRTSCTPAIYQVCVALDARWVDPTGPC